uniref:F-box and regulator of chromosome condensation repeat protein n=1 Tax=Pithovirus LCPAC102 TaxID=2506587 RepID=A0A4D5XFI9_9VIRU|nr:MAG: F-box and regulator of chromosome condensation repeat protein [Pithovirus LCPAC102]
MNICELPEEMVFNILISLFYNDIKSFRLISKYIYKVCQSDLFWQQKLKHESNNTNELIPFIKDKMEQMYINYNTLWGFGSNVYGKLGKIGDEYINNINVPIKIHTNIRVKKVSHGVNHTIIIDKNDVLWSLGFGNVGQLGLGNNIDNKNIYTKLKFEHKVKSVSCGFEHNMLIDENDELWGFGYNAYGQLGLGHNENINIPTKIPFNYKVKIISCGGNHTMIIDKNNELWSFGDNMCGQLGLCHNEDINIPIKIPLKNKVKSVSCGNEYTILIDINDEIWSFGNNELGQLGLGDTNDTNTPTKISIIKSQITPEVLHTLKVHDRQNFNINSPVISNNKVHFNYKVKYVSCGEFHTFIIDENDELWSFGYNESGQLGLGLCDDGNINIPTKISFNYKAKSISCGLDYTIIIDENDELWSFGENTNGQLGLCDNINKYIPTKLNFKHKVHTISSKNYNTLLILKY